MGESVVPLELSETIDSLAPGALVLSMVTSVTAREDPILVAIAAEADPLADKKGEPLAMVAGERIGAVRGGQLVPNTDDDDDDDCCAPLFTLRPFALLAAEMAAAAAAVAAPTSVFERFMTMELL